MLEGVADSMAYVILRNETSVADLDGAFLDGSPGFSRAALVILVFQTLEAHPLGYIGFLVFLTVWTCLALPVTPLEVCAGCVWGPVWGTVGSLTGKTLGCVCALFIGRSLGKSQGWKMPQALESYLGLLKTQPLWTMCAVRMAPIPQGVKNYGLSLVSYPNDVYPFFQYVASCMFVGVPYSIMWGCAGHAAGSLVEAVGRHA